LRAWLPAVLSILAIVSLVGCAEPMEPAVVCTSEGVRVTGQGLVRVEVIHDGLRLARRTLDGVSEAFVSAPMPAGERVQVRVVAGREFALGCEAPSSEALTVQLAAPAGQQLVPLTDGDHPFGAFEGAAHELALVVTASQPRVVEVFIGGESLRVQLTVAGQREVVTRPLPIDAPTQLRVVSAGYSRVARLMPSVVAVGDVAGVLRLVEQAFPTDAAGDVDLARPQGRVTLPGRAWTRVRQWAGLGVRGRDRELPWGWRSVTLANGGARDLDVVLRSRVLRDGQPAPAFRPVVRNRDGSSGVVSALLRVPAGGEATGVLPLFVHEGRLPEGATEFEHELTVAPLGIEAAILTDRQPLQVSRGSSWVALGFAVALLAAVLGVGSALLGVPRWLRTFSTADLTTIAVFATLGFVITAATAVLSSGLAAVLGPFSMLVTGLLSDCLRSALLATLIVLLPRRGTATLFLLLGWLMQGIALGAFSPTDFVFVGSRIFWLEGFLWIAGLTRGGAWRDGSAATRFARLTVGFAGASLLSMAGAIASQIVLFRLYYAAWFVVLMLALPGFLYDVIACALATSFAASLRRVQA